MSYSRILTHQFRRSNQFIRTTNRPMMSRYNRQQENHVRNLPRRSQSLTKLRSNGLTVSCNSEPMRRHVSRESIQHKPVSPWEMKTTVVYKPAESELNTAEDPNCVRSGDPATNCSKILYITNLVGEFNVLQLKQLLARTGKIVDNGFWIDKIKSKCYVKYETEE